MLCAFDAVLAAGFADGRVCEGLAGADGKTRPDPSDNSRAPCPVDLTGTHAHDLGGRARAFR